MPAYNANGTVIATKAAVPTTAVAAPTGADALVRLTVPIYEHRDLGIGAIGELRGAGTKGKGALRQLKYAAGRVVRQADIDAMYPTPTFSTVVTPLPVAVGGIGVITGTDLHRVTALTFGGVAVTNFKVENDLNIRFVVPAGTSGNTVVLTSDGVAMTGRTAATASSVSPATGALAGGTIVTVTGSNLTGATGATVGGVAATVFSVLSDTQVRFTTPAGTAGAKSVVITDDSGPATLTNAFTYA